MPEPNDGQLIASSWEAYVSHEPEDNIFDRYWLLENLKQGKSFEKQNGRAIFHTIEYAVNGTVKWMGERETLDVTHYDVFDQAEYAWKHIAGVCDISEFMKQATANGAGKFSVMAKQIENLKNSIFDTFNAGLFSDGTGTSSKQIGGLQLLVPDDPTTGTRGQISAASFTFWRSQNTSGAKTTTAFDNLLSSLRSIYNLCSNGVGSQTPEFAVTTRTVFEGISGFKGDQLMFKDIPIAYDNDCPSGNAYLLNRRNLKLVYMLWMKAFPPASPVNQFIDAVKILTIANLTTDNPRRLGNVDSIT
jgi:hypothetical protein